MSRDARSEIMGRVRGALAGTAGRAANPESLAEAIPTRITGIRLPLGDDITAHFIAKAEANLMSVQRLARLDDVPRAVAGILAQTNLAPDISVAPALARLVWPATMMVRSDKARIDEKLTVTRATAGIAETGSLVCCSGDEAPSSLTFAGEISVIVLAASDVVARLEDGLQRVKARSGEWPRTVNLVSGPSRTADVAGIVVRPAHGPKAVHLLLVGSA